MQHGFNVVPFGARAKSYRRGNRLHWLEKIVLAFVASVAVIGFASSSATAVSGDLFVSNLEVNDVLEYNGTTGAFVGVFASGSGLSAPAGLVFGPNGNLFVTSSNSNEVLEYDGTTGAFITTFASGGGLRGPQDLTFGPNGDLFVTSVVTNEVLEYNGTTGAFVTSFASTGGAGLHDPTGLAFGPNGDLFVASYLTNQILEYNGVTGAYVRTFIVGDAFFAPTDLTFGPNGNLFVTSLFSNSVLEYDAATGTPLGTFASGTLPISLVFGPNGNLFVSHELQVLEYNGTTGAFVTTFVDSFTSGSFLETPAGLAFSGVSAVPEPPTLILVGCGVALLACALSRLKTEDWLGDAANSCATFAHARESLDEARPKGEVRDRVGAVK